MSSDQKGGRKHKVFEYPDRDTRYVEDLGALQRTYQMRGTIANATSNYKEAKQQFISALEAEGPGILVHPTDGIKTVFAPKYTMKEGLGHLGSAQFELTFVETGDQLFPNDVFSGPSNILQGLNNFINLINTDVANFWNATTSFQGSIQYSADLILGLGDLFLNAGQLITNDISVYSRYLNSLGLLNDNAYSYPTDATAYANNVQELFSLAGQLNTDESNSLAIFGTFFSYTVAPFKSITVGTDERLQNRLITQQLINAQALVYYYLMVSILTFDTEAEIQSQSEILTQQFAFVVENNIYTDLLGNSTPVLGIGTLQLLESLRSKAHSSLNAKINSVPKIANINVKNDSLLSLIYGYYESLELYQTIYDLNELVDATGIEGDFKILTDENTS